METIERRCPKRKGGHNWIVLGEATERNSMDSILKPGTLYRYCNFCSVTDRQTHLCEGTYRLPGRWPKYTTCGRTGPMESPYPPGLFPALDANGALIETSRRAPDGVSHFYCRTHDPVAEAKRVADSDARENAKYNAQLLVWRLEARADELVTVLTELVHWAGHNEDLVEADEWLGQIMERASKLQDELERTMRGKI